MPGKATASNFRSLEVILAKENGPPPTQKLFTPKSRAAPRRAFGADQNKHYPPVRRNSIVPRKAYPDGGLRRDDVIDREGVGKWSSRLTAGPRQLILPVPVASSETVTKAPVAIN